MTGRRARVLAAVGLVLGALLAGCTSGGSSGGAGAVSSATTVLNPCPQQPDQAAAGGSTLPKLSFRCVGGGTLDLAHAPGEPTVVTLWGSWCEPCRNELPLFQQLADAEGTRVRVVGVISKDGLPQAKSFAADAKVTFPSAFDGQGALMAGLGINVLPFTYFLDADGGLTYTQTGPVSSIDQLRGLVADHLGVQP
jgi:cytochrome c biogenesis protein CcmG, thiol:disulfide interchange protein DsbE